MFWNFATKRMDPRRWSMTLRMALFFSLAMAAILLIVSGLLYRELVQQINRKNEDELKRSINIQQEIVEKLERNKWPDVWQHEWREHIDQTDRLSLRVISPSGAVYSESPKMPAPHSAFPAVSSPATILRWRTAKDTGRREYFLLTTVPVKWRSGSQWVVEGSLEVTQDHKIIEAYWTRLSLLTLIATVISGVLGWLLARQGLAPMRAISAEVGRINAEKLNVRIGNRVWPSDLQELAQTFDAMLRRLEASFEQLSRFSSDLAHEFRSPINNLVAAASVTLSRDRPPAEYQETLAVVVEEGERLSRMVSAMLFLARADNAQQALHPEALSTLIEFGKVADFFEALAEEHRVKLLISGDCSVHADPLLLRRALSNLIANALRHTPAGGDIRLHAELRADSIALSVTDTGCGIAAEHLPHLFDRFYRVDAARSSSESTGLGLAVVKSIVELHGGAIAVESSLGAGACFTLLFPSANSQPPK
jgi:two-component system heavy metal sensor histidine kinase CusS